MPRGNTVKLGGGRVGHGRVRGGSCLRNSYSAFHGLTDIPHGAGKEAGAIPPEDEPCDFGG
jgi:hypothetical protein